MGRSMMGLAVHHDLLVRGNASLREHGRQFVIYFEAQLALTIYCIQPVEMYGAGYMTAPFSKDA
jgi:hypothetical protein